MIWLLNKILGRFGYIVHRRDVLFETIAALCCYQNFISNMLDENQIAVYDMESRTVTIETVQ